jgi:hypothetical protein
MVFGFPGLGCRAKCTPTSIYVWEKHHSLVATQQTVDILYFIAQTYAHPVVSSTLPIGGFSPELQSSGLFSFQTTPIGPETTLVFAPEGQLLWLPWLLPVLPRLSRPSRCLVWSTHRSAVTRPVRAI